VILEHAVLQVKPGTQAEFTDTFDRARAIIEAAEGFNSLLLLPCVEDETRYLLLVEWEHLEDHTEGFRGSPAYEEWKTLLHHFYDPFPEVDHYPLPDAPAS
jgi:heme-degrading monooxygenase HmoA